MLRRLTSSSSVEPVLVETVLEIRPEERALHESVLANLRELSPELADVTSTTASTTDRNSPSSEFSKHVSDAKDKSASTKQVTPETLTRFLRARNQNPAAAAKMLAGSLVLPPTPIHSLRCVEDPKAHSFYPIGPSIRGEPVAYSNYQVTNINPTDNVTHMRFAMDHLFREDGLERMIWVMDMHAFSRKHMNPSVARKVLSLFADNYPERLGRAVIYDAPSIFYSLFSAVKVRCGSCGLLDADIVATFTTLACILVSLCDVVRATCVWLDS